MNTSRYHWTVIYLLIVLVLEVGLLIARGWHP